MAALAIHADMGFHIKMLGVTFLGRTHLGVTLLGLVFGRRRGMDDGCIDNAPTYQQLALLIQVGFGCFEDGAGRLMAFPQMKKVQDRGLVRDGIFAQFQAYKPPHRLADVQRIFPPQGRTKRTIAAGNKSVTSR
jgi:hypothetical protein